MHVSRFIKDNLALIAGVGVPIILVTGFIVAGTLGRWLTPPPAHIAYFVAQSTDSAAHAHLELNVGRDKKLLATLRPLDANEKRNSISPRVDVLIAFDAASGEVTQQDITIPQGKTTGSFTPAAFRDKQILPTQQSPDGYSVAYGHGYNTGLANDIFIGRGTEGFRIRKGSAVYRLPEPIVMPTNAHDRYSFYNIRFLGWDGATPTQTKAHP